MRQGTGGQGGRGTRGTGGLLPIFTFVTHSCYCFILCPHKEPYIRVFVIWAGILNYSVCSIGTTYWLLGKNIKGMLLVDLVIPSPSCQMSLNIFSFMDKSKN